MGPPIPLEELAREVRTIYKTDAKGAQEAIEAHLMQRLRSCSPDGRIRILVDLANKFNKLGTIQRPAFDARQEEFSKLFTLLLGKDISVSDLSSAELSEKLASSLNIIFDTINEIVQVINSTLLGKQNELETIRQIIGANIERDGETNSLQNYLDYMKNAFLVAHQSFQQAVMTKIKQFIAEMDPDQLATQVEGSLKFGPIRKAEIYEIYREKFEKFKRYHESGRLMEDLLKEFEKNCVKLYKIKTKENQ